MQGAYGLATVRPLFALEGPRMATKAFVAFREKLAANPLFIVETAPETLSRGQKVYCKACLPPGMRGKKVAPSTAWNYGTTLGRCDKCGWPR